MQKTINAVLFVFAVLFGAAGFSVSANAQECSLCGPAATGDMTKLTELLDAGANPNMRTHYGGTPLFFAARNGQAAAADLLIQNGADKNAQDDRGWTPVMMAVLAHQTDVVLTLIHNGADLDIAANDGWMPLLYAAAYGAQSSLYLAVAENSHYSQAIGPDGLMPLMGAVAGNNFFHARHLSKFVPVVDNNAKNVYGTTALMFAAYFGHYEIITMMLSPGVQSNFPPVQVDARDNDGRTAAMIAAARDAENNDPRYTNILGILANRGADLTLEDNSGFSATDYGLGLGVPAQNGLPPLSPSLQNFVFSLLP